MIFSQNEAQSPVSSIALDYRVRRSIDDLLDNLPSDVMPDVALLGLVAESAGRLLMEQQSGQIARALERMARDLRRGTVPRM